MHRYRYHAAAATVALAASLAASGAHAADVTPDVIFGSGNANGDFTIDQSNGIELGLRGKLRFNESNQPENTFNYDGVDTYTFRAGTPPTGFSFALNSPTTPVWNFEWSVNSDFAGTGGLNLGDLVYELRLDGDPGAGTLFTDVFDPINLAFADHAIGDNTTGNGGGTVAPNAAGYAGLIANNNVAQNSWSYEFFNDGPGALAQLTGFDPSVPGSYRIELEAFDRTGASLAETAINVTTIPVPGTVVLFGAALAALGAGLGSRRRARRASAAAG
jgi:hypothetical protein